MHGGVPNDSKAKERPELTSNSSCELAVLKFMANVWPHFPDENL